MPRPRGSAQLQRDARAGLVSTRNQLDREIAAHDAEGDRMRARRESIDQALRMIGEGDSVAAGRRASGGTRRQATGRTATGTGNGRRRGAAAKTASTTRRQSTKAASTGRQAAGRRAASSSNGTNAGGRRQRGTSAKAASTGTRRRAGGRPAAGTTRRATTGVSSEQRAQQVIDYLRSHGGQALATEIAEAVQVSPQRIRALLSSMQKAEAIQDLGEQRPEGWRGRSPHMWALKEAAAA